MNQVKTQTRIAKTPSEVKVQNQNLKYKDDCKTEELLQAGAKTPLGQLLEKIAQLPEVRYEKVLNLRRQICKGNYKIEEKLKAAADKIIEELLIEP